MATYRIIVKSWDRHYGEGHVQYRDTFEVRESKKATDRALASLKRGLTMVKPEGREPFAWAEISDRHGPATLAKFKGHNGRWVPA